MVVAASATDLLKRADASSTLRLKSFIDFLRSGERVSGHSRIADTRLSHYFLLASQGQPGGILSQTPAFDESSASRHVQWFRFFAVQSRHTNPPPVASNLWW